MYKLFLCLRYLKRRVMAYFAVLSVALCVAMMLIVVSVMDGFLNKIEGAAKGLSGDIIVESSSLSGLGLYDEFIADLKHQMPGVQASPFIMAYGVISLPNSQGGFRHTIQVSGIRLPERSKVSSISSGLFIQKGQAEPSFNPSTEDVLRQLKNDTRVMLQNYLNADPKNVLSPYDLDGFTDEPWAKQAQARWEASPNQMTFSDWRIQVLTSLDFRAEAERVISESQAVNDKIKELDAKRDELSAKGEDTTDIRKQLVDLSRHQFKEPQDRMILGLGIPSLSKRTKAGRVIRYIVPGNQVNLMLVPLGKNRMSVTPTSWTFSVIDDLKTDVSSIDSNMIYVPFETLQRLNEMDGDENNPARCSAIHIKINNAAGDKADLMDEASLMKARGQIEEIWKSFLASHPQAATSDVEVRTWRQQQEVLISNVTAQRTLVIIMFGIISTVAVVLVFVLFYTIVMQKTKDIGVLKAIGASSGGVAQIFLGYGAAVGLVGSAIGICLGYVFVRNINSIHDWVGRTFGLVIWDRQWFMFDQIPNQVEVVPAIVIVCSAILAGIVGALLPAYLAGRMQPVEALRYE